MSEVAGFERWIVLLAGGIGSRFWPASTPRRPKQFLPLATGRPLIVDTVERARQLAPASNILIVTGEHLRPQLEQHLPDFPIDQVLYEPQGRGTAPALAWAAQQIVARVGQAERTVMVSLHSDHIVRPLEGFVASLGRAIDAAGELDRLLTVGVPPSRPETGYGYIELGETLSPGVYEVRRFVEKPDARTAERYVASGGFLWNSGMFIWRPQRLLFELAEHTPELADQLHRLEDDDVEGFYSNVPTLSIDHGLMERSSKIAVVQAEFDWDDVGAWAALMRVRKLNQASNLLIGEAHTVNCSDTLLWAEDGPIVAVGLSGLVVVRSSGITFIAPLERAKELKDVLAELPQEIRDGLD